MVDWNVSIRDHRPHFEESKVKWYKTELTGMKDSVSFDSSREITDKNRKNRRHGYYRNIFHVCFSSENRSVNILFVLFISYKLCMSTSFCLERGF